MEDVTVENGRVTGVRTNRGDVDCEIFVNCAGQVNKLYILYFNICIQWTIYCYCSYLVTMC